MVCADIQSNPFDGHLTPGTHFKYYLLLVDAFSQFAVLLGTNTISSTLIATLLNQYKRQFALLPNQDTSPDVEFTPSTLTLAPG
jgi:hypothetical protein